jgi:tetrahydromethanopterin S-methyltransferase subunit G
MPDTKNKISFSDLDGFLKVAPIIGLFVLGYLQTLFPSKAEFEKVHDKLIQMDKKITEMAVLQNAISGNSGDIDQIEDRLRMIEVELARHKGLEGKSGRKTGI